MFWFFLNEDVKLANPSPPSFLCLNVKHTVKHHLNNTVITKPDNLSGFNPAWTKTAVQVETESQYLIYERVKRAFDVTLTESQKFNSYVGFVCEC